MITAIFHAQQYCIHEALACHYSEYFKAAFARPGAERDSRKISLDHFPYSVVDQFGIYVHWMYYQQVVLPEDLMEEHNDMKYVVEERREQLVDAWQLGAVLKALRFQNDVIDCLFKLIHRYEKELLGPQLYRIADMDSDAEIRKMVIDHVALVPNQPDFDYMLRFVHGMADQQRCLRDLVKAVKRHQLIKSEYKDLKAVLYYVPT